MKTTQQYHKKNVIINCDSHHEWQLENTDWGEYSNCRRHYDKLIAKIDLIIDM
jgi:hypothetical protein